MANSLQTLREIELLIADMVIKTTGIPEEKVLLQNYFSRMPSYKNTEDIAFVKISPELDERNIYKSRKDSYNPETEKFTFSQSSTRTLNLSVIFYGANCFENCTIFNEMLYFQDQALTLKQNSLSIVPDRTVGPTRMDELHNGQWFKRCDLEIRLYNLITVEEEVNRFVSFDIRTEVDA